MHQQNHEIEQAATAVNEMTAVVDEVARNAVSTSEASRESDATAQHGRHQVIKTVESINLLAGDVTTTAAQVEQLLVDAIPCVCYHMAGLKEAIPMAFAFFDPVFKVLSGYDEEFGVVLVLRCGKY